MARQILGSAGPGGTTAGHWKDFLLHYGAHSAKLRDALAGLARCLANSIVEWSDIKALMSSCLEALDKCPGVWLIAIGEIFIEQGCCNMEFSHSMASLFPYIVVMPLLCCKIKRRLNFFSVKEALVKVILCLC